MRWLLFLSRLAFISGICVIIWLVFAMTHFEPEELFIGTVLIIGFAMGGVLLPVTNIIYLVLRFSPKRESLKVVPRWLIIANILHLIILIYYIFYQSDPYYHQA